VPYPRIEPFLLPAGEGYRFCLSHNASPEVAARGAILFVHPFAEEMNKSRRTVAVTARRLAKGGWTVLQIDLEGCGESSGDLADVRWAAWQDDLLLAIDWLTRRGIELRFLWGLRVGALLATSIVARLQPEPDLLLWQPVLSGKTHFTQFLRLKAFEDLNVQSAGQQGVIARLRSSLADGATIEVAGYNIGPKLAADFDAAEIALPAGYGGRVYWLETGRVDQPSLVPVSAAQIEKWRAAGCAVTAQAVAGPPFWQTVEIEEAPELVESTASLLADLPQPSATA
jgi:exosortase A-associated hydrolase 2